MALKHETTMREPGENNTENVQDPLLAANPLERDYTKYNADIKTDMPGQIPDIPEPQTEKINVDFTERSTDPILGNLGGGPAPGDGVGDDPTNRNIKHDIDHGDNGEDDGEDGSSRVDFTPSEKKLMAQVITGMGMQGLGILNDFIVNRWVITEDQVKKRILDGVADPDILDYKINIGATVIDIRQILSGNVKDVEKSLKFDNAEQKRITELVALILKDNNVQMKPEWMLATMFIQKYAIGVYTLNKINMDTQQLLDRVNYIIKINKESHNIPSGPGVTMEHASEKPAAEGGKKQAKAAKTTKKEAAKSAAATPAADPDEQENNPGSMVADMREPGEVPPPDAKQPRKAKRTISKETINQMAEDVAYTKVKD